MYDSRNGGTHINMGGKKKKIIYIHVARNSRKGTRNTAIFQEMSAKLAEKGYDRTAEQRRSKIKKLRSKFNDVCDENNIAREFSRGICGTLLIYICSP